MIAPGQTILELLLSPLVPKNNQDMVYEAMPIIRRDTRRTPLLEPTCAKSNQESVVSETLQSCQEMDFEDANFSIHHRRSKSLEGFEMQYDAPKLAHKSSRRMSGMPSQKLATRLIFTSRKFSFSSSISNHSSRVWCFAAVGATVEVIKNHEPYLHVKISLNYLSKSILFTFVYAKCIRAQRRPVRNDIISISVHRSVGLKENHLLGQTLAMAR
ncbi:hypothetical protein BUALT_Bualt10G0040100 [Buddleja alternifolia]|uniref:Uncharacterized protein n=1 Tax=Buddleja alternifolia TaxID=168488 RepID=A0AAV6X354_9LAMI|nr:hypothetical protein BUALT_Bualt10G0040100 [Buddleja alternifolia]